MEVMHERNAFTNFRLTLASAEATPVGFRSRRPSADRSERQPCWLQPLPFTSSPLTAKGLFVGDWVPATAIPQVESRVEIVHWFERNSIGCTNYKMTPP